MGYKLEIELIPQGVMYSSIYQYLKKKGKGTEWKRLKDKIFKKEGKKCWICNHGKGNFEAHEFWEYDEKARIQKLISIHHLCFMCHRIIHIGFSCYTDKGREILGSKGITKDDLIRHFCRVNGCSRIDFNRHENEAFKLWEHRNEIDWKQDFGEFKGLIK